MAKELDDLRAIEARMEQEQAAISIQSGLRGLSGRKEGERRAAEVETRKLQNHLAEREQQEQEIENWKKMQGSASPRPRPEILEVEAPDAHRSVAEAKEVDWLAEPTYGSTPSKPADPTPKPSSQSAKKSIKVSGESMHSH